MFKSKALKQLLADLAAKQADAQAIMNKEGATADEIKAATEEIRAIKAKIEAQEALDEGKTFDENGEEVPDKTPVNTPVNTIHAEAKDHTKKLWKNNGEFLLAVVNAEKPGGSVDNRLFASNDASGMSEAVPSDGGFLVGQDFASELLTRAYETGVLTNRCTKTPISAGSKGLTINGIDETSRVEGSRFGGIQTFWENEAGALTGKKPKFSQIEMKLHKLTGLCYMTDELMQDAVAAESIVTNLFGQEFGYKMDDAVFQGKGAGEPLGFTKSPALVVVEKETSQAAGSILIQNIVKMWSRMWGPSRKNAVWLINQDIEPQLFTLSLVVGNAGVPVYMPANGVSGEPYATLFGRPVIPIEQASTLGSKGDISLVDLSQYMIIDKGGLNAASSIHVRFLFDESVFRFIYRADGQPLWKTSLKPASGSGNTLSPFITLADRK